MEELKASEIQNITKKVIRLKDLISVCELKKQRVSLLGDIEPLVPSFADIKKGVDFLGEDIRDFYIIKGDDSNSFCFLYYKGFTTYLLKSIDVESLEKLNILESLRRHKGNVLQKMFGDDIFGMFDLIYKNIAMDVFALNFSKIPDNQKYELFLRLYKAMEYCVGDIYEELLNELMRFRDVVKLNEELKKLTDNGYFLEVYRGVSFDGVNMDNAYSWTLSKETAILFALKLGGYGDVYKSKAYINSVLAYMPERGGEILIPPRELPEAKPLFYYNIEDMRPILEDEDFLRMYEKSVINKDYESLFPNNGEFDLIHSKRLTLIAMLMGHLTKLNNGDLNILRLAAMYHNLGNSHTDEYAQDGEKSYEEAVRRGLVSELTEEELEIFEYVMKNHRFPGSGTAFYSNCRNDGSHHIILAYLKDVYYLSNINPDEFLEKNLRTNIAKKMALLAYELKNIMK